MTVFYISANLDKKWAIQKIEELDCSKKKDWVVKVTRMTRSIEQNNLMHQWFTEISKGYREATGDIVSPEVWKEYMKQRFLGQESFKVGSKTITKTRKTRNLPKDKMRDFMDDVQNFVGSEMSQFNIQLAQHCTEGRPPSTE
jgi:hypothetical protein